MRSRGRAAALVMFCALLAGCDKAYMSRIDLGKPPSSPGVPLTDTDRDRAVALFKATAMDLGLRCEPTPYTIITDSYDRSRYRFLSCRAPDQYTDVQLAVDADHVTVEIHQIGGF